MAQPTEEDLRVARGIAADAFDRHTLKHIAGNDYFRLVDGTASAIAAEREKEYERIKAIIVTRKNLYAVATGVTPDTIRIAYDQLLEAIRSGDKE